MDPDVSLCRLRCGSLAPFAGQVGIAVNIAKVADKGSRVLAPARHEYSRAQLLHHFATSLVQLPENSMSTSRTARQRVASLPSQMPQGRWR